MVESLPSRVVLLGGSAEVRLARSAALIACGAVVCEIDSLPPDAMPGDFTSALVVIDTNIESSQLQFPLLAVTDAAASDHWAIIQIGSVPPDLRGWPSPEVELPADATPRELALVCRFVAQIVRLRRDNRQAVVVGERLHELAHRDPLTGLLNRRAWDAELANRLENSSTSDGLCVALIDLDHFKAVNDQFGYAAGDAVLKATADVLVAELRGVDVVVRLGGDEFGVLINGVDRAAAEAVIERLLTALRQRLSTMLQQSVTASIGYRHLTSDQSSLAIHPAACWRAVGESLREAKRQGRDRAVGD